MQKRYLEILFQVLKGTEGVLNLAESRKRDSFIKEVGKALETFYADRLAIYVKFCRKKEDGTPDIIDDKYHFEPEVVKEADAELKILLDEEVNLTVPENIKEIIEKTTYAPKVGEVELIDELTEKL